VVRDVELQSARRNGAIF